MRKRIICIINFILICSMAGVLYGCKEETPKEPDLCFYCVNADFHGISTVPTELKADGPNAQIEQFLNQLQQNDPKEGCVSAIPDSVKINSYSITEKILTIDFSDAYYQISSQQERLLRGAVVLTMDQLEFIDSIAFTVEAQPLIIDGKIVEAMNHNNFASDMNGADSGFSKTDLVLYYANSDGTTLKECKKKDVLLDGMSMEELIVHELIKGPEQSDTLATLSDEVTVNSVKTVDNICYVDFGENFLTEQSIVPNRLVIYSIVNSILELPDINQVQITVDGENNLSYHGDISLAKPFIRNLDLVK